MEVAKKSKKGDKIRKWRRNRKMMKNQKMVTKFENGLLPKERSRASGTACGLVFSRFCVCVEESRESCRDPYWWQKIKFATERTDRELLGRPVARYSAVFVFRWNNAFRGCKAVVGPICDGPRFFLRVAVRTPSKFRKGGRGGGIHLPSSCIGRAPTTPRGGRNRGSSRPDPH